MIVTGSVLAQYMKEHINLPFSEDTIYIGLQRDDLSIAGAVAYNCWLEDSVFMHVAFESHAVSREMIREAFMYPFVTCNKERVYGMTPITSERALRFSRRLGFVKVLQTPDFLLQVISRKDCRWIHDAECWNGTATKPSYGRSASAADATGDRDPTSPLH